MGRVDAAFRMKSVFFYSYREIRDLVLLYLLPMIALVLPWAFAFQLFKWVSKYFPVYQAALDGNFYHASQFYPDLVEKQFNYNQRLLLLVDNADFWLCRFRPTKMMSLIKPGKENQGWPSTQGYIALGLHWGTGFPALIEISKHQLVPKFVFSDPEFQFSQQGLLESAYKDIRRNWFHRIANGRAIVAGRGAFKEIEQATKQKHVPVILYDAPQNNKSGIKAYKLKNQQFTYQIASGFITIITRKQAPYVLFSYKLDINTGFRQLNITQLKSADNTESLLKDLSDFFFENLDSDPSLWYFWKQSPHILMKI